MTTNLSRRRLRSLTIVALAALLVAVGGQTANAQSNLITNGNFEDPSDFLDGWTVTGSVSTSPELVVPGNQVAPLIDFNGGDALQQDFSSIVSGTLDFYAYFVSFASSERFRLRGPSGEDLITLRFLDTGQLQRFSGSWGDVPGAIFAPQSTYRFQVSTTALDTPDRSYDISWSDAALSDPSGELALTNTETIAGFHGGVGPFGRVVFEAGSGGQFYVDEVSVIDTAVNLLTLVVDRDAGTLSLTNTGMRGDSVIAGDVEFSQYSITSGFESLSSGAWTPITGNYDNGVVGGVASDPWMIDTAEVDNLSESDDGTGFASLAVGQSISIGGMDAWSASYLEDINLTYTLPSGEVISGVVSYVGNEVEGVPTPFDFGDLDVDGDIDEVDWQTYKAAVGTDVSALTLVEGYYLGDMDGNGAVELDDFPQFKTAYENANGLGSFAAMLSGTAVPEPSGVAMILMGSLALVCVRVRRNLLTLAMTVVLGCSLFCGASVRAYDFADDFEDGFDEGWLSTDAATVQSGAGQGALGSDSWAFVDSVGQDAAFGTLGDILTSAIGATDFSVDFYARVANLNSDATRELNFQLSTNGNATLGGANNSNFAAVNLRYQNGGFAVFSGGWQPLGDLGSLTGGAWHRIEVSGSDWGLPTASYDIAVSEAGSSTLTRSVAGLAFYQIGDPTTQFAQAFNFNSSFGSNPGFDVDQVTATSAGPNLTLEVNTSTGQATLKSDAVFAFEIDAIELTSGTGGPGSLNAAWDSTDSALPDGDGTGNGWEEVGTSSSSFISESYLLGSQTLDSDVSLGQVFVPGQAEDLAFRFHIVDGGFINGVVEYVSGGELFGDYNGDSVVNLADYTVWRNNLGSDSLTNEDPSQSPGVVDGADYLVWKNNFGQSLNPVDAITSATASIPEPCTLAVAGLAVGLLLTSRATYRR
ncbi:hypothetical protein [Aeoliella sp.]|uniref:hypothetical protein n=1 Tax=Aeoliella sp. TaxID=2795800 RepID=UPI003CCB8003